MNANVPEFSSLTYQLDKKQQLIDAYKEQVDILKKIIAVKDERIRNYQQCVEELLEQFKKSEEILDTVKKTLMKEGYPSW